MVTAPSAPPTTTGRPWWSRAIFAVAAFVLVLSACGGDDSSDDASDNGDTATTSTVADGEGQSGGEGDDDGDSGGDGGGDDDADARETLHILVSNDDSYSAPGIDALVEGLLTIDAVEVTVVAPAEERSGTGGSSTDGPLDVTEVELASGHPAQAVDGYPADAVRVAIDDLGIEPHLVITGINAGQNLGPIIDISGTVGAARAAVARDIPALATSQGWEGSPDAELEYRTAVSIIIDWVIDNRDAALAGELPVEVVSLNVPSCVGAPLRGLAETEPDLAADPGDALAVDVDCGSADPTAPVTEVPMDVEAFNSGFATIGVIPAEPAEPAAGPDTDADGQ